MKKGIILAGGAGTRLYPLTLVASKQLQPVYDKPMIYYPLTTLIYAGVEEICIVSTPEDIPRFEQLLGDGKQWGISLSYRVQPAPKGIAQAFLIAKEFIGPDPICLILGDNLFHGQLRLDRIFAEFQSGGMVFAYRVKDPERYGVVEFDEDGQAISIEEKPERPKSNYAVPGLYLFDNRVVEICENLKPSARGELEITDVNLEYLRRGELAVANMGRGIAWLDTGTTSSLHEASSFIAILEKRQGTKPGCPEEAALRKGRITEDEFNALASAMPDCEYSQYLKGIYQDLREQLL